jgi:hypothetical protein
MPQDRYDRMERDLWSMGFKNVTAVPHDRRVEEGNWPRARPDAAATNQAG